MSVSHLNLEEGSMEIKGSELFISDNAKGMRIQKDIMLCFGLLFFMYRGFNLYNQSDNEGLLFINTLAILFILYQLLIRFFIRKIYHSNIGIPKIQEIRFTKNRFEYYLVGKIILKTGQFRKIKCTKKDLNNSNILKSLANQGLEIKYFKFSLT